MLFKVNLDNPECRCACFKSIAMKKEKGELVKISKEQEDYYLLISPEEKIKLYWIKSSEGPKLQASRFKWVNNKFLEDPIHLKIEDSHVLQMRFPCQQGNAGWKLVFSEGTDKEEPVKNNSLILSVFSCLPCKRH